MCEILETWAHGAAELSLGEHHAGERYKVRPGPRRCAGTAFGVALLYSRRTTPSSRPTVDLIDNGLLSELEEMLGPRLETVIETFIGHLSTYLGDTQQAVVSGDLGVVRAVAHKLKGGAGAIGATRLADAAAALERAAADGNATAVSSLAAPLPALAEETVAALRAR